MGIKCFHDIIFNNVNSVSLKGSVVIDGTNIFMTFMNIIKYLTLLDVRETN